ncbi:MAG: 16S rRNA (guanine(527)-N(7))-methyltransferase RsmG [Bacillota bacterium]|nr:MAG: 16S rRNA (guanine(527)-N(7))-methyltransferase RsmG [Bacillota bacterium]
MTFKQDVFDEFGILITSEQEYLFNLYFKELIAYNEHTNLTRITDEVEVFYKHFFDSLTMLKVIDLNKVNTICDMGAGAGFPSIPLKIIFPHLKVTIIDSLQKRINFLKLLCDRLNILNIELIHDRIENYAAHNLHKFDIVTARALGNLQLIFELGLPMTKVNGHFIAYKSNQYVEELESSKNALKELKSSIEEIKEFTLPLNYGNRSLIKVRKNAQVSGYPRSYAMMIKKPL